MSPKRNMKTWKFILGVLVGFTERWSGAESCKNILIARLYPLRFYSYNEVSILKRDFYSYSKVVFVVVIFL
jgi:hypothetical protein